MPTSIAHAVGGYATAEAGGVRVDGRILPTILLTAVVANLPDMDFAVGLVTGRPNTAHRTITHGVPFALLLSAALGAALTRIGWSFRYGTLVCLALYGSHLVLDLVAPDGRPPRGIPLLWPFSAQHFWLPVPLPAWLESFIALERGTGSASFVDALMSWKAAGVFFVEALLVAPLIPLARLLRRFRSDPRPGSATGRRVPPP